jgi:hypothetical protein
MNQQNANIGDVKPSVTVTETDAEGKPIGKPVPMYWERLQGDHVPDRWLQVYCAALCTLSIDLSVLPDAKAKMSHRFAKVVADAALRDMPRDLMIGHE